MGKTSLKTKVTVMLPCGFAALLLVGAWLLDMSLVKEIRQLVVNQQTVLMESVAGDFDLEMQHAHGQIQHLAHQLSSELIRDPDGLHRVVDADREGKQIFDNGIFLFSPSGTMLAEYPSDTGRVGKDFSYREYFKITTERLQPYISDPYISSQEHRHPAVMFTAPFVEDGRLIGVLGGSVDLTGENFMGRLTKAHIGKTGYFYICDLQRTIILHPDRERMMSQDVKRGANLLLDRAIEQGFEGTGETVNSRGRHCLTTFRRLTSKPWIMGANYPTDEAYAVIKTTRTSLWFGTALIVVFSGLVAHFVTRRMMAPILALSEKTAQLIADPSAHRRLEQEADQEITTLVAAFNQLLADNEQRQQAQQEQYTFLKTLMNAIPSPIFYQDATGHFLGCNHAFEWLAGMTQEELVGRTISEVLPSNQVQAISAADQELLQQGGTQSYETVITFADGRKREVVFYLTALIAADGSITGMVGTYLDISEQKAAEKALFMQKEFTESLLLNATVPAFVIDRQHRAIIWNRACMTLTGVPATEVLGTSDHWRGFYGEPRPCLADLVLEQSLEQAPELYAICRKSPFSDEGMQAEGWYTLAGQRRYVLFTAAPIRDAAGSIVAAIETLEDITDRKLREDELGAVAQAVSISSGEGFFSAVAHYIAKTLGTDYVLIGSIDEKQLDQVKTLAVAAHGGFAPNFSFQLAGTPCDDIMDCSLCSYPHDVRTLFPNDKLLQELGINGYIGMPLLGAGRIPLGILVAMHGGPIDNPERVGALLKIFASRTAAELQRRQDETWLRKLSHAVSQNPVSILITDTSGCIEFVNPQFTRVTGYSADEAIGATPAILKSGETPPETYRELWRAISAGNVWEGVFHNRRKDGELYWERAYIGPIKNERGEITNYIGIKEDITEQKRLEGALRHAHKMEAVGQLAGGVAHDFNNILTAVIGYASILEIHAGDDPQMKAGALQIIKAAERGANLTKSLLTFSRKQAANVQAVDLNEIVLRGEKLFCRLIDEAIELKISLATGPLMVSVDSLEIEQVLMNLVTNARDAMPRGGIVSIVTGSAMINQQFVREYGYGVPGMYAVICVTDNGEGMDQKTADKIFEPFFTTKENGRGTGLGLAIVYNIIKSHKGNVLCTSNPGAGTSFTIYLPLIEADLPPAAEPKNHTLEMGSELILLAEDDPEIRGVMRQFLLEFGYRVEEVVDGEEAVARFGALNEEIGLVVLDAGLPKMSGPEALALMREQRPGLKAIVVSGYAQNTSTTGADGEITRFLAKPIAPADLLRAIREELDR
jgi:two-component system NtrC family sensor kinase